MDHTITIKKTDTSYLVTRRNFPIKKPTTTSTELSAAAFPKCLDGFFVTQVMGMFILWVGWYGVLACVVTLPREKIGWMFEKRHEKESALTCNLGFDGIYIYIYTYM